LYHVLNGFKRTVALHQGKRIKLSEARKRRCWAAGEVFAEPGFRDATIREICEKRGEWAAVNCHFGDKEGFTPPSSVPNLALRALT
jgi:hypothetical protein